MARRVSPFLFILSMALLFGALSGCSVLQKPQRPAWRTQAENACLAERRVHPSAYVQIAQELEGPGICGMTRPFKVTALQGGAVGFNSTATLDCSMVAELDSWLADIVQPAAQARFSQPVAQINSMGSYACRGMNGQRGAPLSEHSFGNALDIGGFVLADGRNISIVRDWTRGDEQTRAFLMDVHGGSCRHFSTVLSPGSNMFHYNHIHVDLAMHGRNGGHICKPVPQETAPPPGQGLQLLAHSGARSGGVDDDDNDTGEQPPLAAFQGPGVGPRDALGPLAAPLPPRREIDPRKGAIPDDGFEPDDPDLTSSIRRR
jgi:hypothetical protein